MSKTITIKCKAVGDGKTPSKVIEKTYILADILQSPNIIPSDGKLYIKAGADIGRVRIESVEGAIIRYTTDASTPVEGESTLYTEPFIFYDKEGYVMAIAEKEGFAVSDPAVVRIERTVATLSVTVKGIGLDTVELTLSCDTPDCEYWMDREKLSSNTVSFTLAVGESVTHSFVAKRNDCYDSNIVTFNLIGKNLELSYDNVAVGYDDKNIAYCVAVMEVK